MTNNTDWVTLHHMVDDNENNAISQDGNDTVLLVKVTPGASRTKVVGVHGERVKIAVAAAPERGKANADLAAFLADKTGLKQREVRIESGATSPLKRIRLIGIQTTAVKKALGL